VPGEFSAARGEHRQPGSQPVGRNEYRKPLVGTVRAQFGHRLLGTPPESAGELDIKRPPAPPILRTAKTVGTGLLAAVVLLITGPEVSAAPSGSPCSAAALACVELSSQQAWLLRGGTVTYGPVPVATGKASAPTAPEPST
jgi:hypothetical protein